MKSRLLQQLEGERTFVIVMETGEEAMQQLTSFAVEQRLSAARFTGLGAFSEVVLGFFELDEKDYLRIPVREQVEVASLVGDIALRDETPTVHAHVVVTRPDGSAWGGHLLEGFVRPTLEILLVESPAHLRRRYDPRTGLALLAP